MQQVNGNNYQQVLSIFQHCKYRQDNFYLLIPVDLVTSAGKY